MSPLRHRFVTALFGAEKCAKSERALSSAEHAVGFLPLELETGTNQFLVDARQSRNSNLAPLQASKLVFSPKNPWPGRAWRGPGAGLVRTTAAGHRRRFLSILCPIQDCPPLNPALSTGLLHPCGGRRIALMQHKQLRLGTILTRAQPCDGAGPAVELPGLWHVVDAQDKGQAAREERVSKLRAPSGRPCPRLLVP